MDKQLYKEFMAEIGLKKLLTQNSKMKSSSNTGYTIYNIGIPAYKSRTGLVTCPSAASCISGCYARQGTYCFPVVADNREKVLAATRTKGFEEAICHELTKLSKKHHGSKLLIRVHDSGDFYSEAYQRSWYTIARICPDVQFYAYTKQVVQSHNIDSLKPKNFRLIFSMGGTQDLSIDTDKMFHAKVFQSESELAAAGYVDGTNDDLIAAIGPCTKIGLVYHGTKKYTNTTWSKVK